MATSDCITIPLTRGQQTTVDKIDSDLASIKRFSKPNPDGNYYAAHHTGKRGHTAIVFLHQTILSRMLGRDLLPGERVDHIDGDGLNNRRENLRLATHTQNMQNRKIHKNNKSGYKGVYKVKGRFAAQIRVNKKKIYLGSYLTPEIAAAIYDEAALKYFGEFALTNKNALR